MKAIFTFLLLLSSVSAFSTEYYNIDSSSTRKAIKLELQGKMINAYSDVFNNCVSEDYGQGATAYQKKIIFDTLKERALPFLGNNGSDIAYRKTTAETTFLVRQVSTTVQKDEFLHEFLFYLSPKGQITMVELTIIEASHNPRYYIGSDEPEYFFGDKVDYMGCMIDQKAKI